MGAKYSISYPLFFHLKWKEWITMSKFGLVLWYIDCSKFMRCFLGVVDLLVEGSFPSFGCVRENSFALTLN